MGKKVSSPEKGVKTKEETVAEKTTEKPAPKKERTLFNVKFFYEWCKSCGICSAMCPKSVILMDETGTPYVDDVDGCIGCRFCEIHCPDFAITVKDRSKDRRKANGDK